VLLIKGLCQVEAEKRITCKELAAWLAKYEGFITELQEFNVNELPDKLNRLNPDKPKPPPQSFIQYQTQQAPPAPLQGQYISAQPARPQQYISQPQYPQYVYDQSQFQGSTYVVSGSGVNRSVSSNNNPSTITFQKDPRSYIDNPNNSQMRGASVNLQQIDEQLQMSRKLFPS
jgi:hypothetical protein